MIDHFTRHGSGDGKVGGNIKDLIQQIARMGCAQFTIAFDIPFLQQISQTLIVVFDPFILSYAFKYLTILLEGWIADLNLVAQTAQEGFIDKVFRRQIGGKNDEDIERNFHFAAGVQTQVIDAVFERNDPAVEQITRAHLLVADMLRSSRISARLGEFRKMPPVSMDALQIVLLRISEMVCELPWIKSLSINPLIIDEHGAIAVDSHIDIARLPADFGRYDHVAVHPYPAHLVSRFQTPEGENITLRPIRPEDAAMEQAFVQTLSPESRYLRFMNTIRELSPMQLVRLTQIDYDRELAFVAVQREIQAGRSRLGGRQRHAQHSVGDVGRFQPR